MAMKDDSNDLNSGDTETLRKLMLQRAASRQARSGTDASVQVADDDSVLPFVLQIPDFAPRQSNAGAELPEDTTMEHNALPIDSGDNGGEIPRGIHQDFEIYDEDPLQSERYQSPVVIESLPRKSMARKPRKRIPLKHSKFGILYPAIPAGVTKSIANTFARLSSQRKTRLGKETLNAIRDAGDLFLTQLGGDLSTFARHAGRKNIDDTDVMAAMLR